MISDAQARLNAAALAVSLHGATISRLQELDKAWNALLEHGKRQPAPPPNPWTRRRSGYYEIFDTEGWSDFARVVVKIEGDEGDSAWGRELSDLLFSAPVLKAENERLTELMTWKPIDTAPKNKVIQVLSRGSKEIVSLYYDQPEGFQGWWRYASYPNRGTHAGWDWTHWREIGDLP